MQRPAATTHDQVDGPSREPIIQDASLGDQVYEHLWRLIATNQLRPGDRLSDLRLSEQLGVSRTPVREALRRLAQDGIVKAETRRGFFVATFSQADVAEIYDLRIALETLAVRLALPHLTAADLDSAQALLDEVRGQLQRGDEGANDRFLAVDRGFHEMLVRKARNHRLAAIMVSLRGQIAVFQVYGIHFTEILALSITHHQAILTALRAADQHAAEAAMAAHIQEVKDHVMARLAELQGSRRAPAAERR